MNHEYIPIDVEQIADGSALSAVASRPLIRFLRIGGRQFPLPKGLSELPKEETSAQLLEGSAAAALGLTNPANISASTRVFVQQYQRYQEVQFADDAVLIGVGFRCILSIEILNSNADLRSLGRIAASAELGYLRNVASFQVIGLSSEAIADAIPSVWSLNIETYAKVGEAFGRIRSLTQAADTVVAPQVLAISRKSQLAQEIQIGEPDAALAERRGSLKVEFDETMSEEDVAKARASLSKAILKVAGQLPRFAEPTEVE